MASRIHFKYSENILISRLYEQFSRNHSAMAPQWLRNLNISRNNLYLRNLQIMCFKIISNIVSVISHCESRVLSENTARYDVIQFLTMF